MNKKAWYYLVLLILIQIKMLINLRISLLKLQYDAQWKTKFK